MYKSNFLRFKIALSLCESILVSHMERKFTPLQELRQFLGPDLDCGPSLNYSLWELGERYCIEQSFPGV